MNVDTAICNSNAARYDEILRLLFEDQRVPGFSIEVLKRGRIVYRLADGFSTPKPGQGNPVNSNTLFNVGSVSKLITGAAIVKLVETGLLSLSDPVAKHIPEYPFDKITLLQLLTHSAGYAAKLVDDIGFPERQGDVPAFLERIYAINELQYEPGEGSEYFSVGYSILMDIIERTSGLSFEAYVRKYIFGPAMMTQSTFDPGNLDGKPYVLPWDDHNGQSLVKEAMTGVMGDRGLYATASDLVRFGTVFLNGGTYGAERTTLFSKAAVELMLREVSMPAGGDKTSIFWRKGKQDGHGCFGDLNSPEAIGHTGFTGCMLLIDPAYETVAALLTNSLKWHGDWRNYRQLCNLMMAMEG